MVVKVKYQVFSHGLENCSGQFSSKQVYSITEHGIETPSRDKNHILNLLCLKVFSAVEREEVFYVSSTRYS